MDDYNLADCAAAGRSTSAGTQARRCAAGARPGLVSKNSLYKFTGLFTETSGKEFKLVQLRGKPSVVVMAYTSCDYSCPIVVGRMKRIEAALPPDIQNRVQFVLISFDTERDTSEKLRNYLNKMHLDDRRWILLHGGKDEIMELAVLLGVKFKPDGKGGFSHSNLITVLDKEGEIVHRLIGLNTDISETAAVLGNIAAADSHARGSKMQIAPER